MWRPAQLGQDAKAKLAFETLLSLDPKHDLSGKYTDKVQRAVTAAQAWAKTSPPLDLAAEPAASDPSSGKVMQIAVKLKADPLKLARKVRFSIRADGAKWVDVDVELQGSYATAGTDSTGIEWSAELLGDRDSGLTTVGSRAQPVLEGKAQTYAKREAPVVVAKVEPAPAAVEKKTDAPTKEPSPAAVEPRAKVDGAPTLVTKEEGSGSALKPVGYVLLAAGVAAAAVGVYFGVRAQKARFTLENPMLDGNGNVSSPTQAQAFELERTLPTNAIIANTLFGAGAALAVAGGICVIVGSTQVSPGAGGMVVSGKF